MGHPVKKLQEGRVIAKSSAAAELRLTLRLTVRFNNMHTGSWSKLGVKTWLEGGSK